MNRRMWLLALAATLCAASCTGSDSEGTVPTSGSEAPQMATTTGGDNAQMLGTTTTTVIAATGDDGPTATGAGVDADAMVIRIGLLPDLSGPFSVLAIDITDAQRVYWDTVNAAGGIDGWSVELVVEDTEYDVAKHERMYEKIRDDVVAIGQATGSTTNLAILERYKADDMLVIPSSWYSGWAVPEFDGGVVLEQNTNYCLEAMNVLDFINGMGGSTIALATLDDDYGRDNAAGVKKAIDFYGMELVFDGEGAVVRGQEQTSVIQGIAGSNADWTYLATDSSIAAEILTGAAAAGYDGLFTGSTPTYDFRVLDTAAAEVFDRMYFQSSYSVVWGTDTPGNNEMMAAVAAAFPDRRPSDAFVVGWNEAVTMHRVLEAAIAAGDLTRSGVVMAAGSIVDIDFRGTAPNQRYAGSPNDYVQRAHAMYDPDLATYLAAGGSDQTVSQQDATTGSLLVKDFWVGAASEAFIFTTPCAEL